MTEFETSSATVEQAAETIGVSLARIAKSLSFRGEGDQAILIVAAGDAKIDNKTFRQTFGFKARMLSPNEVLEQTGHEIGGVCPFGLTHDFEVYLDVSLKRFETVFLVCGSRNSAIEENYPNFLSQKHGLMFVKTGNKKNIQTSSGCLLISQTQAAFHG